MFRVVLADDEQWVLYGLSCLIDWEEHGFHIDALACNGRDALDKCRLFKPDLLISDIRMPGIDGLELAKKVREISENIIIIFVSGYSDFEYAQQAIRMGVFDYLIKQVSSKDLIGALQRVKEFLEIRRQEDAEALLNETQDIPQITAIIHYIEEHCTEEISLKDLAREFYLTENYLSAYIRQQSGRTYTDLVTAKRISLAQKLLRQTSLSIQEIAERVGYTEYSYFSKLFKKKVGCTLSEYRRQDINTDLSSGHSQLQ